MSSSVLADDAKVVESASLLPGLGGSTPPHTVLAHCTADFCFVCVCVCVSLSVNTLV